jgi:hypothetical protein
MVSRFAFSNFNSDLAGFVINEERATGTAAVTVARQISVVLKAHQVIRVILFTLYSASDVGKKYRKKA